MSYMFNNNFTDEQNEQQHQEWLRDEKIFERRVGFGWLIIIAGLVTMVLIGISDAHQYSWIGLVMIIIGFLTVVGISGVLSCIFGAFIDCASTQVNTRDLANNISITQTKVEGRNIQFGKDVMGNKVDNPFKNK